MRLGRCRAAGLCGASLIVWWVVGLSLTRAQTTVGSADVHLPIQSAAGSRLLLNPLHIARSPRHSPWPPDVRSVD